MDANEIKEGMKVRTWPKKEHEKAMAIAEKNMSVRKVTTGHVIGWVAAHGGDVWWVRHDDNPQEIGAYVCTELISAE